MMKLWLIIILPNLCTIAPIAIEPLLAVQENKKTVSKEIVWVKDDIADVRNTFRTLKLEFKNRQIANIFGPDGAGSITSVTVKITRKNSTIEEIEIKYETDPMATSDWILLGRDKADFKTDFKTLVDNIKYIERN